VRYPLGTLAPLAFARKKSMLLGECSGTCFASCGGGVNAFGVFVFLCQAACLFFGGWLGKTSKWLAMNTLASPGFWAAVVFVAWGALQSLCYGAFAWAKKR
jgi:hypothetical protein